MPDPEGNSQGGQNWEVQWTGHTCQEKRRTMCYPWCLWRARKIIARTVKELEGYKLIKTVTKSSGSGWTRKVIVTNKDANAAKKKKWWKKKQENYKPFK